MAQTTGSLSNFLKKDFDKIYFDEYTRYEPTYTKLLNVSTYTDGNWMKEGDSATFGPMVEFDEGGTPAFQEITDGNTKTEYFDNFGLAYQITEIMYEDDRTGHLKKIPKELAKAAAYTFELRGHDIFNSGFVTTERVGLDGLALFSNAHTRLIDSTTYSNYATSSLSQSALETAILSFRRLKNQRGVPIKATPRILLIPPELRWKAKELLLSEYKPDSADNNVNTLKGEGLEYMESPFLTDTNNWFLLANKNEHDLRHVWRRNLRTQSFDDPMTNNMIYKTTARFQDLFYNWRGVYGSIAA